MTTVLVEDAVMCALCIQEYFQEDAAPDSAARNKSELFREDNGSWEYRMRLYHIGQVFEQAHSQARSQYMHGNQRNDEDFLDLGEALLDTVGCWDFDVIPLLLEMFADQCFAENFTLPVEEVQQALIEFTAKGE